MALINNQAVLQKLVDELRLYPAKDKIPTELADKILPVYQINAEVLEISSPPADVIRSSTQAGGVGTTTIYTTPATGKFYLTNAALHTFIYNAAFADTGYSKITIVINGATIDVMKTQLITGAAAEGKESSNSLNFQNPILLDKASIIGVYGSDNSITANATIVGYTKSD